MCSFRTARITTVARRKRVSIFSPAEYTRFDRIRFASFSVMEHEQRKARARGRKSPAQQARWSAGRQTIEDRLEN
jgi:hypothetical protein